MKKTHIFGLALFSALGIWSSADAANQTWNGNGVDNAWLTGGNWVGGVAPSPGDSLFFGGSVRNGNTNNFAAGTTFGGITFNQPAGFFVLGGNSISLAGNITNNQVVTLQTIALPVSLATTSTIDVVTNGLLTMSGVISGANGLTLVDGGQLNLTAANTFTGPLSVLGGTVLPSGDSSLGAAPSSAVAGDLLLNDGTLRASSSFTLNANRGIALGSASGGGSGTIKVDAGFTLTYGGLIADETSGGSLLKSSFGGLTLSGANTYSGSTVIKNGSLTLNFAGTGAPVNNIISSVSPLTIGGETAGVGLTNYAALLMTGAANLTNSQTFNGTTINPGGQFIQATSGAGGAASLVLGSLTHNVGSSAVFVRPAAGSIITTSGNNNGILGGWATIGSGANQNGVMLGTNYATVDANGNITNYYGYLSYSSGTLAGQVVPTSNLLLDQTGAGSPVVMTVDADNAGTTTTVNTIKILNPLTSAYTGIYIGPGNTLRLGQFGGLLLQEGATAPTLTLGGVNNSPQTGSGTSGAQDIGVLTAGGADNTPGEIVLTINNNSETSGSFIIESTITDNGSGPVAFVKSGPGPMKLDGHNSFSGGLYLLQGRVQFAGSEIGTGNPSGGGIGPIYIYPGAELFPSGAGTVPITNNIFMAGNGVSDGVGAIRLTGVFSNGIMTMIGDSRLGGGSTAAPVPIYDQITGAYNLDMGATGNSGSSGNGATLFNQSNNWSGNLSIVGRTGTAGNTVLFSGTNDVIPDGFGKGNVQFGNSGNTVSVTAWDMHGFNETINGLLSIGTVPSLMYISNNTANATSVLTLGNNDQSGTFSGSIVGNIALTKIGQGVETLTGTNTYSGATTVNAGTLALSGAGTLSGAVTVNTGGTFNVAAVTGGYSTPNQVNVNGGTLTGNGAIGQLSMSNGALTLDLNTANSANLTVGSLTTGGATNYLNINSLTGISGYPAKFTLIKYSGTLNGVDNNFGLGLVPNALTVGYITNDTANSQLELVLLNGPKVLTWTGTDPVNPTFWDLNTTVNWLAFKGTANQVASTFNTADSATFDDTASSSTVNIVAALLPGAVSINNSALNYTFTGSGSLGGTMSLTKSGSGSLTLVNSGGDNYSGGVTINGGSVIFDANNGISGGVNIASGTTVQVGMNSGIGTLPTGNVANGGSLIFDSGANQTVPNAISGTGNISKIDASILTLSGANTTFTGAVSVVSGTLKAGSSSALGTADGNTTISSGATLDVNGQTLTNEPVIVSGTGVGNNGAIVNSGTADTTALGNVTLTGNTTFGGTNRWDIRGGTATLSTSGNPYTLTKIGTNYIALVGINVDGSLADINVQNGLLSIENGTTGLGDPSHTLTVSSGATLQLYAATVSLNKQIALNGNGTTPTLNCGSGTANTLSGPITLTGNCVVNAASGTTITLSGGISGAGSLLETSTGTNRIATGSSATYTGGTIVSNGTLVVDGSLSGNVSVLSGATLAGAGTASGNVVVNAGGGIAPGDIAGPAIATLNVNTLSISNSIISLSLSASTVSGNDLLNVTGGLTVNATNTLRITPSSFMNVGDQYTVIQYVGSGLTSAATNNFVVASATAGFTFAVVDPSTTPGTIQIKVLTALGNDFWTGQTSSTWDTSTINWKRSGNAVNFNANDYANFDDTSTVTNVNLSANISASGITVSSTGEAYQFTGPGGLTGSAGLHLAGVGLTLANTGTNNFTGPVLIDSGTLQIGLGANGAALGSGAITNNGSIVFNVGTNLTISNNIAGSGSITDNGTGVVSLAGSSTYSGSVNINQGTLRVLTSTALGNASGQTTVSSGATLDITNTANLAAETINVSGTGVGGNGAIVNNSGNATFVGQNIAQIYLNGDTTFGGSGRLDFRASTATAMDALVIGGYNLTKVGTNLLQLAGVQVDPSLGNIDVKAGTFGVQWGMPFGLGNSGATLTIYSNATLAFFTLSNAISKVLILNDGSTVAGQSGSNVFSGPVTLNGNDTFNIGSGQMVFNGPLGGTGNLVKTGTASLILSGSAEAYTGNTYVNQGSLMLSDIATIATTPSIVLSNSATIDVSLRTDTTLTLGASGNQSLLGGGTVNGNLVENSGSTVNPGNGLTPATLTISNNATLSGAVIMDLNRTNQQTSDKITASTITAGGTLTVANLGPDLITSNRFQLFNLPVSGFSAVSLPSQNAAHTINYVWQNNLSVDGSILLLQGASPVNGSPTNIVLSVSDGNLNLSWPADHTGWRLQVQTNSLTTGLGTNWVDVPGSTNVNQVSIPISPVNGSVFYRMVYP